MLFDFIATPYRLIAANIKGAKRAILANLAGIGDGLDETSGETVAQQPLYGQIGFYCRPDPPSDAGYAEIIALKRSDGCAIVSGRDLRLNTKVNPSEGECGVVQYGGGFISLAHNANAAGTTTVIYAPKVVSGSVEKAHAISLDTSTANLSVSIVHANGMAVLLTQDDKLVLRNVDGTQLLTLSTSEIVMSGVIKLFGGVVAGDATTAVPVALAPTLIDFVTDGGLVLGKLAAAVNILAPGTISPTELTDLADAIAPYTALGAPTVQSQTLKASPV